ncbi:MAG: methylmalonyl-CoA decarboxylase [Syntrophobacteraceae bacterium]|nr:methylmalonyl-CoA decarboxylase [Syntrophobacteraceae bacterium]
MSSVACEIIDNVGIIRLNNPGNRNALSRSLVSGILGGLRDCKERKVPSVILRAQEGCSVWSAGIDVTELALSTYDPFCYTESLQELMREVQGYPGPVIAMVHGSVWGGACDLVMTCDIVVGDETSSFAITPTKLALPYNASGILHFINRLGLNIAKEMFFSAEPVMADRAERVGILNHLVESGELVDFTMDLARRMASRSALAVSVIKEQFNLLAGAHPIPPDVFERVQGLRRLVFESHDYKEGVRSFLEKRPPVFTGE